MAELARASAAPRTVDEVLTDVTSAARELIPGADTAGVLLIGKGGKFDSVANTSDLPHRLDELQMTFNEGPCVEAALDELIVRTDDFRSERRWPRYAAAVVEIGILSGLSFKLYTAEHLQEEWQGLDKAPANKTIEINSRYSIILTVEKAKAAKEFEWHEGRDHVIQIIDGETNYEVGGTPKSGHSTGPGEWLAPESEGATKMTLKKGDMLIVPRGTEHRPVADEEVEVLLFEPAGTLNTGNVRGDRTVEQLQRI